jgi:hypothetical protein
MPINYIPNDPQAGNPPIRVIDPHVDRPAGRAGFQFFNQAAEGQFDPPSDQFLYWQCREAALRALDAWEALDGSLAAWVNNNPTLDLIQKGPGSEANAFYSRTQLSLEFFEFVTAAQSYFSGASTDVVAHETGHGILDAIRPDILPSFLTEADAFHEAFGDCMALITALADRTIRRELLAATPDLGGANFVEATAEDLSDGIRQGIDEGLLSNRIRNASVPRHALNTFQWQLPMTLASEGDPGVLLGEIHSFGQVFSGCFWDLLSNILAAAPGNDEAAFVAATQTAGRLLIAATKETPLVARFFREVGRTMVLVDRRDNGGANVEPIEQAFDGHGIALDVDAMLTPTAELSGRAPAFAAATPSRILTRASRRDIVDIVGRTAEQRFFVRAAEVGPETMAVARHRYYMPLDDVDEQLAGVEALVEEDILVGESDGRAAVLGVAPSVDETRLEVMRYVRSLMDGNFVDVDGGAAGAVTHHIESTGTRRVLRRFRYACRCG